MILIYQTIHSFPDQCEPPPTEFRQLFLHNNNKDNNVSSIISAEHFDI